MKKWLTFILLLITLTGTFYPCCMEDECNEDEIATSERDNKEAPQGSCSPFFACATCSAFTHISKPVQIVHPVMETKVNYGTIVISNLTSYSTSFWQPPRSC